MDGLTRSELDKAEARDAALGKGPLRPRDAATLILLDRRGGEPFVLMGRRHARHAFMPGKFVFPGGRTDPADSRVPVADGLHPAEQEKIASGTRIGAARVRAIALSAVRETYEEAGMLIGRSGAFGPPRPGWEAFAEHGVQPSLACLRFVARAITPPGRVRRYDTRFFACWRKDVAVALPEGGPTDELEEIVWLPLADAGTVDLPVITKTIVGELRNRLAADPLLGPGAPVPFFRMSRNRFVRDLL